MVFRIPSGKASIVSIFATSFRLLDSESGFNFNSFCVYNNTVYGAKDDGIYTLEGETDAGTAFHPGIVLPQTKFGIMNQKRFRKAYFGISGSGPVIKVETESGSRTYKITASKAAMARDMRGVKWVLSLSDFDSLDFIELIPVILHR